MTLQSSPRVLGDSITHTFIGYHQFVDANGGPYGSFEVFHHCGGSDPFTEPGFYWHACYPGCLADAEPVGPFPTAEGAYLDAIGE